MSKAIQKTQYIKTTQRKKYYNNNGRVVIKQQSSCITLYNMHVIMCVIHWLTINNYSTRYSSLFKDVLEEMRSSLCYMNFINIYICICVYTVHYYIVSYYVQQYEVQNT